MLFISPRFVYLIAALCGLYLSVAPFLSSIHCPVTFFRVSMCMGTVLLLTAAMLPTNIDLTIRDSYRVVHLPTVFALLGSTVTTVLLCYHTVRLVELKLGLLRGTGRVVAFQPTMFDRVNRRVSKPILLLFLISSVASLLVSALLTLRMNQPGSPPLTEGSGK